MKKLSKAIVKSRYVILIVSLLLLIPSIIGYAATRVNYDILSYLPDDIETMEGQDILEKDFGTGAYSMFVVEGMNEKDTASLKAEIEDVAHVKKVIWYDSIMDLSVPMDMLPDDVYDAFNNGDATMMFIIFDETTSSDGTMNAIRQIRQIAGKQCFLSGMSSIVTDTKDLAEEETPLYVLIAVVLATIVLSLTMDNFLVPIFFLLSIGLAIMYNLGSNIVLGEISFITKSLSAVLQLGVTLDYSIFLWHSFEEQQELHPGDKKGAMAEAITATFQSIIGSSITTIAGFIALCFMSFTIGLDLGIVMAKGVVFGVISCVTILPSMILVFDNILEKTKHKPLLKEFVKAPAWIARHYKVFALIFLCLLPFAIYGNNHTSVYYDLANTLPASLPSSQANAELDKHFESSTAYMILADSSLDDVSASDMCEELSNVDGVDAVLGIESLVGAGVPSDVIPDDLTSLLENDDYQIMLITSKYKTASDEVNAQIDDVSSIVKSYDPSAMVVGEAPCTKDLITITNHDFTVVNFVSILLVFAIILIVMKSISLPVILVAVIEFAIFVNMGIPYYTGSTLPFIASIVIGTIQLGSTVDYAILMTTRYCRERQLGKSKQDSTEIALATSMKSIVVSALSFFSATFGVGLVSSIDMIGSLCYLMSRGALISMCTVILVLPAMYMIFDPLIIRTTFGFKDIRAGIHEKKLQMKSRHSNVA